MAVEFPVGHRPRLFIKIADSDDVGFMFEKFEWKSFTNGGYIIRSKLRDSRWKRIRDITTQFYLDKGRKEPTKVEFELEWPGVTGKNSKTGKHLAFITDLDTRGVQSDGTLEFIAVDPPSYWLNAGDSSGDVYEGTVKEVMEQVIQKYFVGPNGPFGGGRFEISETSDSSENKWWQMRQDPKTFLSSLMEWSSSITENKTNWIVSSDGAIENGTPTIWIKEQADRDPVNYGTFAFNTRSPGGNDIYNFDFLSDNFISVFQKQLITHGISSVSGKLFDRKMDTDREIVHVRDENTSNKKNVDISRTKGFAKPSDIPSAFEKPHEWSSSIESIPEIDSSGSIGITYDKYIDGKARSMFLNMIKSVMRIKFRSTGVAAKDLANSHNLGVSKLKVIWREADVTQRPYFLDGDWMVDGFHHIVTRGHWWTDLYCYRLDYNADAQKV